jgi:hypothetical protein
MWADKMVMIDNILAWLKGVRKRGRHFTKEFGGQLCNEALQLGVTGMRRAYIYCAHRDRAEDVLSVRRFGEGLWPFQGRCCANEIVVFGREVIRMGNEILARIALKRRRVRWALELGNCDDDSPESMSPNLRRKRR